MQISTDVSTIEIAFMRGNILFGSFTKSVLTSAAPKILFAAIALNVSSLLSQIWLNPVNISSCGTLFSIKEVLAIKYYLFSLFKEGQLQLKFVSRQSLKPTGIYQFQSLAFNSF